MLAHGGPADNFILTTAIREGHYVCVKLLVAHGLPNGPYRYADTVCQTKRPPGVTSNPLEPDQVRCLRHVVDAGREIHAATFILAVQYADMNLVRYLHTHGTPLWEYAWVEEDAALGFLKCACERCGFHYFARKNVIILPRDPEKARQRWQALRYGWVMGAPVSRAMEEVFDAMRDSTRAVLFCFHVASQLSPGEGSEEEKAVWAAMGRVPIKIVEKILLLADLEIPESLGRGLPRKRSVSMRGKKTVKPGAWDPYVWGFAERPPNIKW
jgi:hypothetical protein